ncbi:MAG TPA: LamG domain-containing protein [Rariglobus sp.]
MTIPPIESRPLERSMTEPDVRCSAEWRDLLPVRLRESWCDFGVDDGFTPTLLPKKQPMNTPNTILSGNFPASIRRIFASGCLLLALVAPSVMRAQTALIQYDFDEGTGTTAASSGSLTGSDLTLSSVGTHLTWASSSSTLSGSGSALVMDGANRGTNLGYVTGDGTALNTNLSAFTITLWVNLSTPANSDRLLAFTDGSNGFDLRLNTVSGNNSTLSLNVDGGSATSTSSATVGGEWVFIAVSYDGTQSANNVSIYNGTTSISASLLGSVLTINSGSVNTLGSTNLSSALRVGSAYGTAGSDRTPAGMFDDIRIYDSVLDASEIEAVRASAISIPEPSVAALVFAVAGLVVAGARRRRR